MVHKIAYLANHLLFLLHCFCNNLYSFQEFQNTKTTGFGALAGQIQHMAAQKVRFMPRLLRQVALTCRF
jgi:hypothetical protein